MSEGNNTNKINDLVTRVAVIEKDGEIVASLFERFDKSIEILTNVSNELQKLVAVQSNSLEILQASVKQANDIQEQRRNEALQLIKEFRAEQKKENDKMKADIVQINKWRFTMMGVYLVIGFIVAKLPIIMAALN